MEYTYDTLLASCQNYCIDDSTQYVAEFPNLVQLSEMLIIKLLGLAVFDTVTGTVNMTTGSQSVTKPTDMIVERDFYITVNSSRVYLQKRSKSWLDDYWPNSMLGGQPAYYCDANTTTWLVAPTPDSTYLYQVNYIARPTPMSSSNQTTWLGTKLGECMLYATLLGSMPYFREDVATEQGITNFWQNAFTAAIQQARAELQSSVSARDNIMTPLITRTGA